jgi:arylsulfatase A-like enzyme
MSKPLSVLFILADQHNAKVLGCKGHPDVKTPHLDRLAAEGVRFDNAITQNPICTPSRVCFLSGQYPHNHGYYGLSGPNPRGLPTVLGHFRRAGYRTAAMGKIHCPEYWVEDGCDVFHETCDSSVGGRSPAYAAHLEARGLTALEDHVALNEFGKKGRQSCDGRPSKVSYEDGQEGWCAATASAFMESCSRDGKPFFLHVSLPKPHQCFTPAQPFWDLYDEARLTLPPNADYDMAAAGKSPLLRKAAAHWRKGDWALFEPRRSCRRPAAGGHRSARPAGQGACDLQRGSRGLCLRARQHGEGARHLLRRHHPHPHDLAASGSAGRRPRLPVPR